MIKIIVYLTGLFFLYFVFGFFVSQKNFLIVPERIKTQAQSSYFDYRGVMNIHSNLGTGSFSPDHIIQSAKLANLDFIFLSDYSLEPVDELEGYNGNLLVLSANELGYLDSRLHLYSKQQMYFSDNTDAQIKITDMLSESTQNNPDEFLVLTNTASGDYNWTGDIPEGLLGLEILNPKSLSKKHWNKSKLSVFWSLFLYPFNYRYSFLRLMQDPSDELILWDQINVKRKFFAFSGADANARAVPFVGFNFTFPSYQKTFEIMSNHVILKSELTGSFKKDKEKIYQALREGQFYSSVDLMGDPTGFNAILVSDDRNYLMGSQVKFKKNMILQVDLNQTPTEFFEIVLFKNGERVDSTNKTSIDFAIKEPGVYRVQVRVTIAFPLPDGKKWITWIYSNPFYIN